MKFTHLHEIVKNVQATLTCSKCQAHFSEQALDVVDIVGNKGVFAAQCVRCNTSMLVTLNIREFKQRIAAREKQVTKVRTSKVTPSDVIEIKNFLGGFDGDFANLLAEPKLVEKKAEIKKEEAS